jgi:hypothetical protein
MKSPRMIAITTVSLCLLFLGSTLAVSHMRWPNSRQTRLARAAGRYHAHKKTESFYKRATPGGVSQGR